MHRVGIIPFNCRDDMTAVLFVTSQTRGRWILPKGKRKDHESQIDACLREGFEEAGVRGKVMEDFPMTQLVTKQTATEKLCLPVTYYPLFVTEQVDNWPEKERRQRHWALIEDAPNVAYREDFHAILNQFKNLIPWIRTSLEPNIQLPPAVPMPAQ